MYYLPDFGNEYLLNEYLLQQKTYGFRMDGQQTKQETLEIDVSADYFREETDKPNLLEEEVAEAVAENKKIDYLIDEYYKTYHMSQAEEEIKEENKQKDSDFLQTATAILF